MATVGSHEARTHLYALLDRVAKGETITITRRGTPVAVLSPTHEPSREQVKHAIERLKQLRKGTSLGGLTFRELIDEGRRY